MISRVWHGWTAPENADAYESLLKTEIFSGIQSYLVDGYRGIHLLRRDLGDEVEFVTMRARMKDDSFSVNDVLFALEDYIY